MATSDSTGQATLTTSSTISTEKSRQVKASDQSERFHRFVSVERLGAYSDAVFSIIVTFMIIPLSTSVEDFQIYSDVKDNLIAEWHLFFIYIVCYFFVFSLWEHHVRVYEVVEHVGDVVIVLNVIQLLAASMLPFLLLSVLFAYRRKKMMRDNINKREAVIELCSSSGILLCLSTVSAAIAFLNTTAAWVILGLALFADTFSIIVVAIYQRFHPHEKYHTLSRYLAHRLITTRSNPDRTKNLTDGVFAIVATLIILDLTNAAANPSDTGPGSIKAELQDDKETFFSYFATFSTVGMIWYVHYTVFHPIQKLSRITSLCNKWVLLFVGVLPMGFKLISKYSTDTWDADENTAVQFNCAIIFGASICQLLTWLSGHWKREKHLHVGYGRIHVYWCLALLLVYPTISLLLFLIAFSPSTLDANAVQAIQISVPALFCVIKMCFEIYVHKAGHAYHTEDIDESDPSDGNDEASVDTNL
ncbi:endosomal/lysosomal proton channel TMEM175-like isoform X2 [Amphiura filiformis]|uniref:endosomal/lysosomal proton channel TMEM175-like isoform X2 n=1 Tax=Amphiura filiformis TaxID=82378 RepID=UPI003B210C02